MPICPGHVALLSLVRDSLAAGASIVWGDQPSVSNRATPLMKHNMLTTNHTTRSTTYLVCFFMQSFSFHLIIECIACLCIGNTCYLNSIMQVLYYTPSFVDNVRILNQEMRRTITDYNMINTVTVSTSVYNVCVCVLTTI